jgi:hypothetical protein
MRTELEEQVRDEASIVWLRGGPDDYPYLREVFRLVSGRTRPVRKSPGLVAYATLRPTASSKWPGRFDRRVWLFRSTDPYPIERTHPNYAAACPMEAVKPHSIAAGKVSEPGRE